ncbi:kinase-like domain-containing protein [Xylaria sp. FL0933]|nr:kinase-like domain-containing protein [Xylaria sp. FL0933]
MASYNTAHLSNILCLFRILRSATCSDLDQFLRWNNEFEFTPPSQEQDRESAWKGTLNLDNGSDPIYGLLFSNKPKNDGQWVFGSLDSLSCDRQHGRVQPTKRYSRCDFQLSAKHNIGNPISRMHFAVEISPRAGGSSPVIPRLKCLKGSVVVDYIDDPGKSRLLRPGHHLLLSKPVNITCQTLQLQMWCPTLTIGEQVEQGIIAYKFEKEVVSDLPEFFPPIGTAIDTRYRNNRVGLRTSTFYVSNEEEIFPTTSIIPSCVVWSGGCNRLSAIVPPTGTTCPRSLKITLDGFVKAADYGANIHHENILSIKELAVFRGATPQINLSDAPWLITEDITGASTLEDCIQSGYLMEIEERYEIIAQLAAGLDYLRYKGFVHTSLVPENIAVLIKQDGAVLAKIAKLEALEKVAGQQYLANYADSPTIYSAVEVLKEPYRYSYPAAVYSLGIIALRMLTSFDSKMKEYEGLSRNTTETYKRWLREVVSPSLEQAPYRTRELVNGLLRTLPPKRWTAEECFTFLQQGLLPRRDGPSSDYRPQKRKREVVPDTLARAPVLDKGLVHTLSSTSTVLTAPTPEPLAKARKLKQRPGPLGRRPSLPHISEEEISTEAEEQPVAEERRQNAAEETIIEGPKDDDSLPDTLPFDNGPEEPHDDD